MTEHEIMTAEEVAEYLRVSERTIYDWAQKGEIPSGKLGNVWRFKRQDVESWLDQRLEHARPAFTKAPEDIQHILPPERVLLGDFTKKREALEAVIDCLAETPDVADREALARAVYEREELMSTGIGLGIAVPHVRVPWLDRVMIAACVSKHALEDYASLDGAPIRIVFLIAAGSKQHSEYLRTLARLTTFLRDEYVREQILNVTEPKGFLEILTRQKA